LATAAATAGSKLPQMLRAMTDRDSSLPINNDGSLSAYLESQILSIKLSRIK
jgi:hypothetical protein